MDTIKGMCSGQNSSVRKQLDYRVSGGGIEVSFSAGVKDFSLLDSVPTGSGAHFPLQWVLRGRGMKLTTQHHLMLRLRILELYLHSPIYFQDMLN